MKNNISISLENKLYLKRLFYFLVIILFTLVPFIIYTEYKRSENLKITDTITAKITCNKKRLKNTRSHICIEYEYNGIRYHKQISDNFETYVKTGSCIQIFVSKKEPNTIKANYSMGTFECR